MSEGFDSHPLDAKRDAFFLLVDVEHLHLELLADLEQFARVAEAGLGHVGDMQEAVDAVEVDEGAEVGDVLDRVGNLVADLHAAEEGLTLLESARLR